jgi:toxin CcdB
MARFDVHQGDGGVLLLDCQTDFLEGIKSRLMAPLYPAHRIELKVPRLNPVFDVAGSKVVMLTPLLSAVPINEIGRRVGALPEEQDRIMAAIDMLLSGF